MKLKKVLCAVLCVVSSIVMVPCEDATAAVSTKSSDSTNPFRVSLSVSPFTDTMFSKGYVYKDNDGNVAKSTSELQELYEKHGANEIYTRISTDRRKSDITDGNDTSLELAIERATLAKKLGVNFNPEIAVLKHYGDVMGQPTPDFSEYPEIKVPGSWDTLTLDQMKDVLKQYGTFVASQIKATDANVNVWDIGNEVNFGFAGVALGNKVDKIDPEISKKNMYGIMGMPEFGVLWLKKHLWNYDAQLMQAVKEGILTVYPNAKFSTHIGMIPPDPAFIKSYFQTMKDNGYDVDEIGLSYYPSDYPYPSDRVVFLKDVIKDLNTTFGKKVFLAEFGYNTKVVASGPYKDWKSPTPGYELTPEGQAAMLKDLTAWGKDNGLSGIRPWGPDYVGAEWDEFSFFELSGKNATAKPGLDAMKQGLGSK